MPFHVVKCVWDHGTQRAGKYSCNNNIHVFRYTDHLLRDTKSFQKTLLKKISHLSDQVQDVDHSDLPVVSGNNSTFAQYIHIHIQLDISDIPNGKVELCYNFTR